MKATILTQSVQTMNSSEAMMTSGSAEIVQPKVIRKKELAKRLSVSTRTVDTWMAKRLIPYIQITPRFYLYEFDAVLEAIKKHYQIEPVTRT
jgi:hypothetical protein